MIYPPLWSAEQLSADVQTAEQLFRSGRLAASQAWTTHYLEARAKFEALFRIIGNLASEHVTDDALAEVYNARLGDALRYLAGPPISEDDLRKIADVGRGSASNLSRSPEALRKIYRVVEQSLDPFRFPWVALGTKPAPRQQQAALLSSSVLLAAQTMATARRHDAKREQELAVKSYLQTLGLREVAPGRIATIVHGPGIGEFCGEALLGTRKADVVVRLPDTRILAIECKVSNSQLNSVKRINNDAAAKAEAWIGRFGTDQVVAAAVMSGVFGVTNLLQAQDRGLCLFWAHDLERLGDFIRSTESKPATAPRSRGRR